MQTRRSADWLSVKMIQDGHQVAMLTAELSIRRRPSLQSFPRPGLDDQDALSQQELQHTKH